MNAPTVDFKEELSDAELLDSIEKEARDLWHKMWDAGAEFIYAHAHRDLVPGTTRFNGCHRIIVSYIPGKEPEYFYRTGVFTQPTPLENRDEALIAISMFRKREAVVS